MGRTPGGLYRIGRPRLARNPTPGFVGHRFTDLEGPPPPVPSVQVRGRFRAPRRGSRGGRHRHRSGRWHGPPLAPPRASRALARPRPAGGAGRRRPPGPPPAPRPAGAGPAPARARGTARGRCRRASRATSVVLAQGARAGDRGEVGEPDLQHHGPAAHAAGPQPGRPPARTAAAARAGPPAGSSTSRAKVSSAPMLRSACSRDHRSRVPAPGQLVQVAAGGLAQRPAQCLQRGVRDVGHGAQPEPAQRLLGACSPTPHSAPTGSGCRNVTIAVAGTTSRPSGLARAGGQLRHELGRGDADRAGDPLLVGDPVADPDWAICAGLPSRRTAPDDVEERLVQAERLDQRRDRAEDLHHAARRPRRSGGGRGATTTACGHSRRARRHRHRGVHPEPARLVGGRQHHPAAAAAADDHRLPAQLGRSISSTEA